MDAWEILLQTSEKNENTCVRECFCRTALKEAIDRAIIQRNLDEENTLLH